MMIELLVVPEFGSWEGKIFYGIIGFSWASYLWQEYISYRQRKVYFKNEVVPTELKDIIDKQTYDKARLYSIDKNVYSMVEGVFTQVVSTGIMLCGGFPALWNFSGSCVAKLGYEGSSEIPQSIAFVCLGSVFNLVMSLPWSAYFTFKIEQKHGFNKQTPGFFIKDTIKKFIVTQIITAPVVSGLVYIIQAGGEYFFVYMWGFTTVVVLFFMTIYPDFIAPLFDKYEPLPDGELRTKIEDLAQSIKFPLTKIYVVEGSKRSAHSNAYFYGFYKNKRIVLYDTLIQDYSPFAKEGEADQNKDESESEQKKKAGCATAEVLAVLGHELGHWKLGHILQGIVLSQVNLLLIFSAFGSLYHYSPLYTAFGFHNTKPAFVGLIIVLQYVFAPYHEVLNFFMTVFTRHNEFQADAFAVDLGHSKMLQSALVKLNADNLGFPVNDWLFSTWHHSHPPLLERIKAIEEAAKKQK